MSSCALCRSTENFPSETVEPFGSIVTSVFGDHWPRRPIVHAGISRTDDLMLLGEADRRVEMRAKLDPAKHRFMNLRDRSGIRLAIRCKGCWHRVVEVLDLARTVTIIAAE